MNLNLPIEDIKKDVDIIKLCIEDGKWCSPWAAPMEYPDMLIDEIYIFNNIDHNNYYGVNDVYIGVRFYHDKLDDKKRCYSNGYLYSSRRIVRLSDIITYKRYNKIKQLKEKICQ